jgi:hypothetical protein
MLLLEQAGSEAEGMTDQYRPARFEGLRDALVSKPQVIGHRTQHELQATA